MSSELYATHAAYELVKKGMPFRDAYLKIGKSLNNLPDYDANAVVKESNHIGGTGNLKLSELKKNIVSIEKEWKQKQRQFQKVIKELISNY